MNCLRGLFLEDTSISAQCHNRGLEGFLSDLKIETDLLLEANGIDIQISVLAALEKEGFDLMCAETLFSSWFPYRQRFYAWNSLPFNGFRIEQENLFVPYLHEDCLFEGTCVPSVKYLYTNAFFLTSEETRNVFPNLQGLTARFVSKRASLEIPFRNFDPFLKCWVSNVLASEDALSSLALGKELLPLHSTNNGKWELSTCLMPRWKA